MNCTDFDARLHEHLDARRAPDCDAELAAHARECPACGEQWLIYRALLAAAAQSRAVAPAAGFADRVLAAVRQAAASGTGVSPVADLNSGTGVSPVADLAPASRWTPRLRAGTVRETARPSSTRALNRRAWAGALAAAAAMLIVAVLPTSHAPVETNRSGPAAGANDHGSRPQNAGIGDLVREAGTAYASLARETVAIVADADLLLPIPPSADEPTGPQPRSTGWLGNLGEPLRPLVDGAGQALDIFWRAIPEEEPTT